MNERAGIMRTQYSILSIPLLAAALTASPLNAQPGPSVPAGVSTGDATPVAQEAPAKPAARKAPGKRAGDPWKPDYGFHWNLFFAGQAYTLFKLDDDGGQPFGINPGDERVRFGVKKFSVMATARFLRWFGVRAHLIALPDSDDRKIDLMDLHLMARFHRYFGVKVGRFKKTFTDIYTPFWAMWRFFDVTQSFKHAKGSLGLAGRGYGLVLFGGKKKNDRLKYFVGVFNGAEEIKVPADSVITDKTVQLVGRVESQIIRYLAVGAGVTWQPGIKTTTTDGTGGVTTTEKDQLAYAVNLKINVLGLEVVPEFIGFMTSPKGGDDVLGGGIHVDVLYRQKLGGGLTLWPAFRFAQWYPNFDDTDRKHLQITGAVNLAWRRHVRIGLEISYLNDQRTPGSEVKSTMGLLQVVALY